MRCIVRLAMRWLPVGILFALSTRTAGAEEYGEAGSYELGGTASLAWGDETFTIEAGPTFGVFVWDRIELSVTPTVTYQRTHDDATDTTTSAKSFTFILEPSYHHPISEAVQVLGGLGIGTGWDGDHWDFEIVPRVGVNFVVARGAVITPSLRVPIKIGKAFTDDGSTGTDIGLVIDIGVTTTW